MGWVDQYGEMGNFRGGGGDPVLPTPSPRATAWPSPFPVAQPSHGGYGHPHPWYRVLWEELLVAAFEDIHLRIVEAGVVVGGSVPFPDETAPGTSRGVRFRAGRAVGCTSGDLVPEPTPLRALGNHRRLEWRNVSHKNTFRSVWLTGYRRGWGDRRNEANQGGSVSRRQLHNLCQRHFSWAEKGRQKGEKWTKFKR